LKKKKLKDGYSKLTFFKSEVPFYKSNKRSRGYK
jgi:hypothetical protein